MYLYDFRSYRASKFNKVSHIALLKCWEDTAQTVRTKGSFEFESSPLSTPLGIAVSPCKNWQWHLHWLFQGTGTEVSTLTVETQRNWNTEKKRLFLDDPRAVIECTGPLPHRGLGCFWNTIVKFNLSWNKRLSFYFNIIWLQLLPIQELFYTQLSGFWHSWAVHGSRMGWSILLQKVVLLFIPSINSDEITRHP